ncbi:DoxX family protein [Sulfurospirillum arcachonense]|uniref:HvfX family Cu-binding RiPP maturation protein n=1 Tax=Sulfurospirillum arcachonense TaxID=57666 RepID=UPI0004686FE0|nr:DoxX family protein [Sulfurospirillum arcachonense]
MSMKNCYFKVEKITDNFQSIALLFARLTIAYGFFEPAMKKWQGMDNVVAWFGSMGIPFPSLNAYMAASTETLGVVLLTFGLFTRLISIPLIVIMLVAIFLVHFQNGFSAAANGFEIPFYYMLFLMIFTSFGAGKISLDNFFFKK